MAIQFIIEGARKDTGEDAKIIVEADDVGQAEQIAYVRGLYVSSVRPRPTSGMKKPVIAAVVVLALVGVGTGGAVWLTRSRPAAPPPASLNVPTSRPLASAVSGRICIMGKDGNTEPLDGLEVLLLDDVSVDGKVIRQEYKRHVTDLRAEASRQTRMLHDPGLVTPQVVQTNLAQVGAQIGELETRSARVKPRESLPSTFGHLSYIHMNGGSSGLLRYVGNEIVRQKAVTGPDGRFVFPSVPVGRYCLYAELANKEKNNRPRHAEWFMPVDVKTDVSVDLNTDNATNYRP